MAKEFAPNLKTPEEDLCKEELNKGNSNGMQGDLSTDFQDGERGDVKWETEQLAKSYGIYLEFDRAKTGREKDWSYMVRLSIPGGGPITKDQWNVLDAIAEKYDDNPYGPSSLRLTTRQNIQYHWIKKESVALLVKEAAESGLRSLNGCGDNTRNVMGCPMARFSNELDVNEIAHELADFFELPKDPFIKIFAIDPNYLRTDADDAGQPRFKYGPRLLNRKFKIAVSGVQRDDSGTLSPENCIEALTNDVGVVPVVRDNAITGFQIYVGGGQGEKNGKPTMATLGKPLAIVSREQIRPTLDAVVQVHQEWGDRQNRHWARLKYVIKKQGVEWYREQVQKLLDYELGAADESYDVGPRELHHGWQKQASNGKWAFGMYVENGRLHDTPESGNVRTAVREALNKFDVSVYITANQDLIFSDIEESQKDDFEALLRSHGWGQRHGKDYSPLRMRSGACVGRDTCRLTYTDSEKFEPELLDQVEELGWGHLEESIGITGCERQCFRPATKTIGLIGTGLNRYQFKLMGSEDGRFQGVPILSSDKSQQFLRSVPREKVAVVIDSLFRNYDKNKNSGESVGEFHRRVGMEALIDYLKADEATTELMESATQKVKAHLEP